MILNKKMEAQEGNNFNSYKALIIPINPRNQIFIQDRRGFKKPDWGHFGGGIEANETPLEAVIRESKEELDIDVKPDELKYLGTFNTDWNGNKIVRYIFLYPTIQKDFKVLEGAGGYWLTFDEARKRLDNKERFDYIVDKIKKLLNLEP